MLAGGVLTADEFDKREDPWLVGMRVPTDAGVNDVVDSRHL